VVSAAKLLCYSVPLARWPTKMPSWFTIGHQLTTRLTDGSFGQSASTCQYPISTICKVAAWLALAANLPTPSEYLSMRSDSSFGACGAPVSEPLRWDADAETANRICCDNHLYAETKYSWEDTTIPTSMHPGSNVTFYDVFSHSHLFTAPVDRTYDQFIALSTSQGWPAFRPAEATDQVRILPSFSSAYYPEVVSLDGTHLGHILPDIDGYPYYCINIVCVAGPTPYE